MDQAAASRAESSFESADDIGSETSNEQVYVRQSARSDTFDIATLRSKNLGFTRLPPNIEVFCIGDKTSLETLPSGDIWACNLALSLWKRCKIPEKPGLNIRGLGSVLHVEHAVSAEQFSELEESFYKLERINFLQFWHIMEKYLIYQGLYTASDELSHLGVIRDFRDRVLALGTNGQLKAAQMKQVLLEIRAQSDDPDFWLRVEDALPMVDGCVPLCALADATFSWCENDIKDHEERSTQDDTSGMYDVSWSCNTRKIENNLPTEKASSTKPHSKRLENHTEPQSFLEESFRLAYGFFSLQEGEVQRRKQEKSVKVARLKKRLKDAKAQNEGLQAQLKESKKNTIAAVDEFRSTKEKWETELEQARRAAVDMEPSHHRTVERLRKQLALLECRTQELVGRVAKLDRENEVLRHKYEPDDLESFLIPAVKKGSMREMEKKVQHLEHHIRQLQDTYFADAMSGLDDEGDPRSQQLARQLHFWQLQYAAVLKIINQDDNVSVLEEMRAVNEDLAASLRTELEIKSDLQAEVRRLHMEVERTHTASSFLTELTASGYTRSDSTRTGESKLRKGKGQIARWHVEKSKQTLK